MARAFGLGHLGLALVALLALDAGAARAGDDDITGAVSDVTLMGDLDQHDLAICKNAAGDVTMACGPAAAVNSFVFLEKRYPKIYGESLVTLSLPVGQKTGESNAGAILGKDYMSSTLAGGTTWTDFVKGKTAYLKDRAPGTTKIDPKTNPTPAWIAGGLNGDDDIEVLFSFRLDNFKGHYVTATKLEFDTLTSTGTIFYIDPLDGKPHKADITSVDGVLGVDYTTPAGKTEVRGTISQAVSESPISTPEPGAWALMILGFAGVGVALRRAHLGSTGSTTLLSRSQPSHSRVSR